MKHTKSHLQVIDKKLSDYTIHWLVLIFKLIPAIIAFICNLAVRYIVCPFVTNSIDIDALSASKEVCLVCIQPHFYEIYTDYSWNIQILVLRIQVFYQIVSILLDRASKITLRSGYIAIGTHNSVIDFIYYSYLINPVFVKVLIYKK